MTAPALPNPVAFWRLRPISFFFFSSRRRHTRCLSDWGSDVCSSDLGDFYDEPQGTGPGQFLAAHRESLHGAGHFYGAVTPGHFHVAPAGGTAKLDAEGSPTAKCCA